ELGVSSRIFLAASRPFRMGIPISSTTMSGCSCAAFWTASRPSLASVTCHSGYACNILRTCARHSLRSSTTRIRTLGVVGGAVSSFATERFDESYLEHGKRQDAPRKPDPTDPQGRKQTKLTPLDTVCSINPRQKPTISGRLLYARFNTYLGGTWA